MAGQEVRQSPGAEPGFFYGYIVVVAAFCIMVIIWSTFFAFGVFFKPVLTEFGWSRAMTSGAFSFSMIVQGLLGIVMGGLTDRLGPRIVMMTGIVLAGLGIGTLIGPPVANQLISAYDWRISYIIMGSVVLIVIVSAAQLLKRDPTRMGQVPYGESEGGEQGLKLEADGFSLGEAVYTRQFWLVSGMVFCFGFSVFAIMVHIAPHATELGISATKAATILAAIGGLDTLGRVVLGSAADRIGSRQVYIISFILMSAALFWLVPATELWMLYLFAVFFGLAHGGMGAVQSPLIAGLFGLSSHGLILGVNALCFTIGAAVGPFFAGYIFDITGSYQVAFLVCAAIGIVGLVLTALLTPVRGERSKRMTI